MIQKHSRKPIAVLIFGNDRILKGVFYSLNAAAEITGANLQAISFCCTGRRIRTAGIYFRHLKPESGVNLKDLGVLRIEEYDNICGDERKYFNHKKRRIHKKRPDSTE